MTYLKGIETRKGELQYAPTIRWVSSLNLIQKGIGIVGLVLRHNGCPNAMCGCAHVRTFAHTVCCRE